MKLKLLFTITVITALSSVTTYAQPETVSFQCPNINEVDRMGTRTSNNNKTVLWKVTSGNNLSHYDKPVEFMQVILKREDPDSYDKTVSCVYRTKNNKKYILMPLGSFHWYVDGVAEKATGNHWHVASNGDLECSNSVKSCAFQFR
ncbi:TPA: hypothetical protein ACTUNV_003368 [Legionella pneumophila]